MLASLLIFLREGIEGSMIVTIMCTYLIKAGRPDLVRVVLLGSLAALTCSAVAGVALYALARDSFINSTVQVWFETGTFVVAVVVLTYMTFWMRRNSRSLSGDLKARMGEAIAGGSAFGLASLAFVTVGRESIETVIFLLAIAFKSSWASLLSGALLGLGLAAVISIAVFRMGIRLNFKRFFNVMGALLMVVAAGLLADAVQNLQELGVLPGGSLTVWDTTRLLPDNSNLGDILHGLVGYASSPSLLQVLVWALFLSVGLAVFFHRPTAPSRPAGPMSSGARGG
ncbi:MAG TPA: FTR1 family protein [Chloroflexota bacterium]|jgi:high-affinity iron transporter